MGDRNHTSNANGRNTPGQVIWNRGLALLAVLWVLTLLALMASTVTRISRTEIRLAHNAMERLQAESLAHAGVHWAVVKLSQPVDSGGWKLDGKVHTLVLGTGEVRVVVGDEDGKIDLNAASPELLESLFLALDRAPDESAALAGAIADFRDPDDSRLPNGAEDDDYAAAGLAHDAKDTAFEEIDELQQVFGMSGELYGQVRSVLTVHTRRRVPNRATAGPLVLAALSGQKLAQRADAAELPEEASGDEAPVEVSEGAMFSDQPDSSNEDASTGRPLRSRLNIYAVHAEGRTKNGAVFARDAVLRITGRPDFPFELLNLRQGRRSLFSGELGQDSSTQGAENIDQN